MTKEETKEMKELEKALQLERMKSQELEMAIYLRNDEVFRMELLKKIDQLIMAITDHKA